MNEQDEKLVIEENVWYSRTCIYKEKKTYPDTDHQFFEFIRFGAVVFHDSPDPEERDKSGEEENSAEH